MKKLLLTTIAVIALCFSTSAQYQTLFGRGSRVSGFGAPIMEFGQIDDQFSFMFGGQGGILVNSFFIGIYGQGLVNEVRPNKLPGYEPNNPNQDYRIGFGHGGLYIGNSFFSRKAIHLVTSLKTGWGAVALQQGDTPDFDRDDWSDQVMVITPEIGVEMNFTRFMRISLTAGYRFVDGVELNGYQDSDFQNFTGQLAIQFGGFSRL